MSDETRDPLETLILWAQDTLPTLMQALKPDDDPTPVLLTVAHDGTGVITPLPEFFRCEESKEQLYVGLGLLFARVRPKAALLVNCGWARTAGKEELDDPNVGRVSEHPDRKEVMILNGYDGVFAVVLTAGIVRRKDAPPALEPWDRLDLSERPWGKVAGALIRAFDAVKTYNRLTGDVLRN